MTNRGGLGWAILFLVGNVVGCAAQVGSSEDVGEAEQELTKASADTMQKAAATVPQKAAAQVPQKEAAQTPQKQAAEIEQKKAAEIEQKKAAEIEQKKAADKAQKKAADKAVIAKAKSDAAVIQKQPPVKTAADAAKALAQSKALGAQLDMLRAIAADQVKELDEGAKKVSQAATDYRTVLTRASTTTEQLTATKALVDAQIELTAMSLDIQTLMAELNEAETLMSSVMAKQQESAQSVLSKML